MIYEWKNEKNEDAGNWTSIKLDTRKFVFV